MALPVKALKVGQENYWLDQIANDREQYFSGKGESPGRWVGEAAATSGLHGEATPEQVRAMFRAWTPPPAKCVARRCGAPTRSLVAVMAAKPGPRLRWRPGPRERTAVGPDLRAAARRSGPADP